MTVFRSIFVVLLVVTLAACASGSSNAQRPKQLKFVETFPFDPERNPSLDGIWSNARYGVALKFDGANFEIYNRIGQYCWPERVPALRDAYVASMAESSLVSDKSKLTVRRERGDDGLEFQPIASLPADCEKPKDQLAVFDVFVELMRQYYPNFERRGVMWTRTTADLRRSINSIDSDDELLDRINTVTADLGDPNLKIFGPDFVWTGDQTNSRQIDMLRVAFNRQDVIDSFAEYQRRWYAAIQSQISTRIIERDAAVRLGGNLIYGRSAGNIGYLYVADTSAATIAEWVDELELALDSLASTSSLIIDLSMADGGRAAVTTALAAFMLPRKTPMYLRKINRIDDQQWSVVAAARNPVLRNKPVYLLLTNHTSGAGELAPLILRGVPGVRFVGETTRGALSQPSQVSLPNGWVIDVPIIILADRQENLYDGIGFNPDFALELFSESQLTDAHWQAVQTLNALIQEGHFNTSAGP
ncbi:MAG: S41 family peptidase [Pseudomonadota bacterium]